MLAMALPAGRQMCLCQLEESASADVLHAHESCSRSLGGLSLLPDQATAMLRVKQLMRGQLAVEQTQGQACLSYRARYLRRLGSIKGYLPSIKC